MKPPSRTVYRAFTPAPDAQLFAAFLQRLALDRDEAGEAYEALRHLLMRFFEGRGCHFADELADETLNRAIKRIGQGEVVENLSSYCFGIARFVLREQARAPGIHQVTLDEMPPTSTPVSQDMDEDEDARLHYLQRCLRSLPEEDRALLIDYHRADRRAKVDLRQALADRLGIARNALTKRVVRLRDKLELCVKRCLKTHREKI